MIAVLVILAVIVVANIAVWGSLLLHWLGVPSVRLTSHPGRHVSTGRVHAGGRYLGTLPRRDALPLTEQEIDRAQTDDDPPWMITTAAQPVLTDEPLPSAAKLRSEYYRWRHPMPVYNEACQLDVLEGERLAGELIA